MISNSKAWSIILRKEIIDNLRDRRTLITMAVSIVIAPLLMFGFLWFAEKTVKEETDLVNAQAIKLPVVGAQYAPNLINWLAQRNIVAIDAPADPEQALRNGDYRVVLKINKSFKETFESGKAAPILLIHDSSISGLEKISYHTVRSAISAYSSQISQLRLTARGIDPQITTPIRVNISDVATPESRNAQMLSMMPYLIIFFIMAGGMYLAIDTTAGERENGSLEPLLTQPAKRSTILLAKLGATITFSGLTLLLVLIGLALSFKYAPIDSISLSISVAEIVKLFISCFPFVLLGSAIMILLASFTKSYKEAQSYMGMVMMVPTMPLFLLVFLSPEPSLSNMWIPSLSQGLIIIETLKGDSISIAYILLSMFSSSLLAALLAWISVKLYQREQILG